MIVVVLALGLAALLIFGPQLWARRVLQRYSEQRGSFPGTGGELARRLLDGHGMAHVSVEATAEGDHYDPTAKAVRLTPDKLNGRSLTAVVVAAHEVGHALQDHTGYRPLGYRTRLVAVAQRTEKLGSLLMLGIPVVTLLSRRPVTGLVFLLAGLATLAMSAVVHLITLPVELDASFRRALPMLHAGDYLSPREHGPSRHLLTACAFTYLASSLASLLNLWRWLAFLRR
jgi:uncharacterized protein